MKILVVAATPFFSDRGCHVRIYNETKYLKKFGNDIKICTYFSGENIPGFEIERIGNVGWYKKKSPGFSWGKFWLDIKLIFLCRGLIKSFSPDVIHAHLYEGLGVAYVAKKLAMRPVPIVADLQSDLREEFLNYSPRNFFARWLFVGLSKILISRCDWLVLSSENLIERIRRVFKREDQITVIRDGINLDLFHEVPLLEEGDMNKIDKIREWKGNSRMLAYIGGLSDNKGVRELIKAFGELQGSQKISDGTDWKLLLGGYGEHEEDYKKYIMEHDLADSIYFVGKVGYFSLPYYLSFADAGIDPKRDSTESSGKLVNLMAAGLPIICFENEFNWQKLGERGYYLVEMKDLGKALERLEGSHKRDYQEIEQLHEKKEVEKLLQIFERLKK